MVKDLEIQKFLEHPEVMSITKGVVFEFFKKRNQDYGINDIIEGHLGKLNVEIKQKYKESNKAKKPLEWFVKKMSKEKDERNLDSYFAGWNESIIRSLNKMTKLYDDSSSLSGLEIEQMSKMFAGNDAGLISAKLQSFFGEYSAVDIYKEGCIYMPTTKELARFMRKELYRAFSEIPEVRGLIEKYETPAGNNLCEKTINLEATKKELSQKIREYCKAVYKGIGPSSFLERVKERFNTPSMNTVISDIENACFFSNRRG